MQQAMNNAEKKGEQWANTAEKQGEKWAGKAHTAIDRGVSELKSLADTDLKAMASDIGQKAKDYSADAYRGSVDFVKKYPMGSALGLAAVGFFAGVWAARSRH